MDIRYSFKSPIWVSRIATIIVFLALIRSISEPLRLQYYARTTLTYDEIKPFLIGSLIAASGLFVMTVLYYFSKYKAIITMCILTIVLMLIVKKIYLIP